jgi:lysophospholipase L1-like esterase
MIEDLSLAAGDFQERSFIVNVRTPQLDPPPENAPGGRAVRLKPREVASPTWDDRLTLELMGTTKVASLTVEPADVSTVYLAGDSTVTDQPTEPAASWGQMLPRFFRPDIAVANHAESGETLKSFLTELRLDKVLAQIRPGDWLLIQFGHNDEKVQWPQTYVEAGTTYQAWLRVYIAEARRRGAIPVLVTSPERRNFDDHGHIVDSHGAYPDAVRTVAREESVALIDLHAMSKSFYEALGPDRAPLAFNDGGRDRTHHDNYGAYELARMVVTGIRKANPKLIGPLASHLAADAQAFDPAHPDAPEQFRLPASDAQARVQIDGN